MSKVPCPQTMDEWYTSVQNLPVIWSDLSMIDSAYLRKVIGYDFHEIRTQINAPGMWGTITPDWALGSSLCSYCTNSPYSARVGRETVLLSSPSSWGTAKKFYSGTERNWLGSYGVRKSSSSRRGDNKALHPVHFGKWKCWGMWNHGVRFLGAFMEEATSASSMYLYLPRLLLMHTSTPCFRSHLGFCTAVAWGQ